MELRPRPPGQPPLELAAADRGAAQDPPGLLLLQHQEGQPAAVTGLAQACGSARAGSSSSSPTRPGSSASPARPPFQTSPKEEPRPPTAHRSTMTVISDVSKEI